MSDTIFPTDFYLPIEGRVGRVNWLRKLSSSLYVESGVTFPDTGGCALWILSLEGGEFTPVMEWLSVTEEEMVVIVDTIKERRTNK